jgi:DNA-binding transcriptional LysR family regulator
MEFRHLSYFIAVAEERHFSRAAGRVGIEQSPLSRAIRRLERDLGVALLQRSTRGSFMTPAGEIFLHHARSMIEAAECARRAVRTAAETGPGTPGAKDC